MKMDQKEYDEYVTDGILCDSSKDISKPEMKSSLTKEELVLSQKKQVEKRREKAAAKRIVKQRLKKKKP